MFNEVKQRKLRIKFSEHFEIFNTILARFFHLENQLIWIRAVTKINSFSNVKMPQTRFWAILHKPSFTKKLNLVSSSNFKSLFFVKQANFNAFESSSAIYSL